MKEIKNEKSESNSPKNKSILGPERLEMKKYTNQITKIQSAFRKHLAKKG